MTDEERDYQAAWLDLRARLDLAAGILGADVERAALAQRSALTQRAAQTEVARLGGKKDGVRLALSYMDEWERTSRTFFTHLPGRST